MLALLILAENRITNADQQSMPDWGIGIAIIVGMIIVLALGALAMHFFIARRSRASRGGVQPPRGDRGTRHNPPFESIEHRS